MFNEFLKEFKEFGRDLWHFLFPKPKVDPHESFTKLSMSRFKEIHEKHGKAPVLYAVFGELKEKDFEKKAIKLDLISMMVVPARPGSQQAKDFIDTLCTHLEADIKKLREERDG